MDTIHLRCISTISFYAEDLEAAKTRYGEILGVAPYFKPITNRSGGKMTFVTASVVDPFDNNLVTTTNPHYFKI